MPSQKQIKRRIVSVKNTQKITRAMKLISVARFAKANTAVSGARPYARAFSRIVRRLLNSSNADVASPFLRRSGEQKSESKVLIVVLSTDRGLCGGLNTNLFKKTASWIKEKKAEGADVSVIAWGRRIQMFAKKQDYKVIEKKEKVTEKPNYDKAKSLAMPLVDRYISGEFDAIYLSYMEFKSAMSQIPTVIKLLPIDAEEDDAASKDATKEDDTKIDYIIEPNFAELIHRMLEKRMVGTVLRCLLEAVASEHGARMTAMDSATKNAGEVIRKLTLQYNRARQAVITKELIEITSGAEAL